MSASARRRTEFCRGIFWPQLPGSGFWQAVRRRFESCATAPVNRGSPRAQIVQDRCLISANGCSKLSNKIKLNNSPRLGNTDDQTLLVYPNPTSGAINVSIPGNESDAVTITITNIAGEIIWVKQNVEQLTNVVLPETIASGTYLITVQNSSGTAHSTLVIN